MDTNSSQTGVKVNWNIDYLDERLQAIEATGEGDGVGATTVAEASAVKRLDERVTRLDEELIEVEDYVYEWTATAESYLKALARVVGEKLGVSLDSYIETVEAEARGEEESASLGE